MAAALPYVDEFLPVHNLRSLEQLGEVLAEIGGARRRNAVRASLPIRAAG
jgi:hypothetical protein